jgi:hypothetical protein
MQKKKVIQGHGESEGENKGRGRGGEELRKLVTSGDLVVGGPGRNRAEQ